MKNSLAVHPQGSGFGLLPGLPEAAIGQPQALLASAFQRRNREYWVTP